MAWPAFDAGGRRARAQREGVLNGERKIERAQLELHATGFDLGEIEDVVDEREQVATEPRITSTYASAWG